eukprot:scaffold1314_cov386-Pavlova_lutheri.AAC.29
MEAGGVLPRTWKTVGWVPPPEPRTHRHSNVRTSPARRSTGGCLDPSDGFVPSEPGAYLVPPPERIPRKGTPHPGEKILPPRSEASEEEGGETGEGLPPPTSTEWWREGWLTRGNNRNGTTRGIRKGGGRGLNWTPSVQGQWRPMQSIVGHRTTWKTYRSKRDPSAGKPPLD